MAILLAPLNVGEFRDDPQLATRRRLLGTLGKNYDWDDQAVHWDLIEAMCNHLPFFDRTVPGSRVTFATVQLARFWPERTIPPR